MERKIYANQKLGEIVSIFPVAGEIFNNYKIDYCCGGHDSLLEALKEKNLEVENILEELNTAYEKFITSNSEYIDWRKESPVAIIKHVIRTHHEYTKKELREIDPLMSKILKVHFKHHSEELLKVHRLFGNLKIELEEHLVKEEEKLFPLIVEFAETKDDEILAQIHEFITETESEHDAAGDILKELEKVTRDYHAPEGACTTYKLVYSRLHALEKDLFIHIYLENSVLFDMLK